MILTVAFTFIAIAHSMPLSDDSTSPLPLSEQTSGTSESYISHNYVASDYSISENRDERGQYGLSYITSNGLEVSERGYLKAGQNGTYIFVKEGSVKYLDPNGEKVSYKFIADENGFVVENL